MLLEKMPGCRNLLIGKTVLLTGGGGGIGLEAAKSFACMGANLIIAEIDAEKGKAAVKKLTDLYPDAKAAFFQIDLSDEQQVRKMHAYIVQNGGFVDILFHNAAVISIGNVEEVPLNIWEASYRVNFRAPLLLTQLFLPLMKEGGRGTVVFVSSSGAAPFMGAYEVFKTAQAELSNTLSAELEGTGVYTFTISPGLVKTDTAMGGIKMVAEKMGLTTEAFYAMNDSHILSAEDAGCGFAVSVLAAQKYHGQEIGSIQALLDAGLLENTAPKESRPVSTRRTALMQKMIGVYNEQYAGWMERNIFERQWVLRDFKKTVGIPAGQFKSDMERLHESLLGGGEPDLSAYIGHFEKLTVYFQRQHKLLQGFEKDPGKLKENSQILLSWIETLKDITEAPCAAVTQA